MSDLNTFKEVDRKLARECQRLREDSVPYPQADQGATPSPCTTPWVTNEVGRW